MIKITSKKVVLDCAGFAFFIEEALKRVNVIDS